MPPAADDARVAHTNTDARAAQRAPPETPDSERTSFHSARSVPPPASVTVSQELHNVLDTGLEPLDDEGTPAVLKAKPRTPRNTTPRGYERHTTGENQPPARRGTWFGRLLEHLPDWLQEAIFTSRAWKNWFRSMVAAFAMMVIMVARRSRLLRRRGLTGQRRQCLREGVSSASCARR